MEKIQLDGGRAGTNFKATKEQYEEILKHFEVMKNIALFNKIIEKVKLKIKKENNVLKDFSFQNTMEHYVWVSDHKNIIGDKMAHYEVILEKLDVFVKLHFESEKPEHIKIFEDKINLENSKDYEWKYWGYELSEKWGSIVSKIPILLHSKNASEEIIEKLFHLENELGEQVRKIKLNLLPYNMEQLAINTILYGPPGTGKTYNTINKAISICNPNFNLSQDRKLVKAEFDRLKSEGQIVFTTFHQSMSYEDFIEGIKPQTNNSKISYEVKDGIFKELCLKAKSTENSFTKAYNLLIADLSESSEEYFILKTCTNKTYRINLNSNGNLSLFTSDKIKYQGVLSKNKLLLHSRTNNEFKDWEGYANGVLSLLETNYGFNRVQNNESANYVIIIDEINRGNVSAIFGELITLIESDKREGEKEALSLTLPYSLENFSIPNNVYIIGTMNTADRSVEALDTALRRRFSFVEMMPNYNVKELGEVSGIRLAEVLQTINERIEILIDRDHTIGHSYFVNVNSETALRAAFKNKIIPLLQEYFYGDYGKIGLVLGSDFVQQNERKKHVFANFPYEGKSDLHRSAYELRNIDNIDMHAALLNLLNKASQLE